MRNIVVFLDGTRNKLEGDQRITNVGKLFMLASTRTDQGDPQINFYAPGVGTYSALDKWTVLAGVGFQVTIRHAYQFIGANYEPDSRIFIFGFSRVRSARDIWLN